MPTNDDTLTLAPTADPNVFLLPNGTRVSPPAGWACLPPGDAGLTRRVKAAGPSWTVVIKKGRKTFSQGLWAPAHTIEAARATLESERGTEAYATKLAKGRAARQVAEVHYASQFEHEVYEFLRFAPAYEELARAMALAVTRLATPVGSGTVARTKRIPVAKRAEAAVIAWLRHQTTAYDHMQIPRVKGARREVRRQLATVSRALLDLHRTDAIHREEACPLCVQRVPPELP